MIKFKTAGVAGAGIMGSALAQKFIQEGMHVILADRTQELVEKGINNIKAMLNEGVQKKVFSPEQVAEFLLRLKGTASLDDLKSCDIVIEAIYENIDAKSDLFKKISKIVSKKCIIATNTSSFSVNELSKSVKFPQRFIGMHFFYHAAKNRLVEIIPGKKTSEQTVKQVKYFTTLAGKDAIICRDSYGFAVNRFFVPWLNEAVRLYENGVASMVAIDNACKDVFGIGMGPFELMNATGVQVAYHAEKTLEVFGYLYKVAGALEQQARTNQPWSLGKNETSTEIINPETETAIKERMLGIVFLICCQLLDEKICTATDLNKGAKIGLKWKKGPVEMMHGLGVDEVKRLILKVKEIYNVSMPESIGLKYWVTEPVQLVKNKNIAVLTINQPENLNALNEALVNRLLECFEIAENDHEVKTIFITGSGKAFVAGADIKFFVKNIKENAFAKIESFTKFGQNVFEKIDRSEKKVVAILNGLALGGGLELALCADVILASPKAIMAFPETGIGIYPGLGGTQRSIRRVGKALSKYLICSGKVLTAKDGYETGMIDAIVEPGEIMDILDGTKAVPEKRAVTLTGKWKAIEEFFSKNGVSEILDKKAKNYSLPAEEAEKLVKTISFKAPIAIKIADRLIEEEKGCQSELTHLKEIFSTSDALLGLSNIGKKVTFEGK